MLQTRHATKFVACRSDNLIKHHLVGCEKLAILVNIAQAAHDPEHSSVLEKQVVIESMTEESLFMFEDAVDRFDSPPDFRNESVRVDLSRCQLQTISFVDGHADYIPFTFPVSLLALNPGSSKQ